MLVVNFAVEEIGRNKSAFNNEKISKIGLLANIDEKDFDLKGVFLCIKQEILFLPIKNLECNGKSHW